MASAEEQVKKEIAEEENSHTFESDQPVNAVAFQNGELEKLTLAVGSLKMEKNNKVEILKFRGSSS